MVQLAAAPARAGVVTEVGEVIVGLVADRDRVLTGAIEVADAGGDGGLTIRSLAEHLHVQPMAIYHHVAKGEIRDGLDRVLRSAP
jgi:AcrR family transcriptional regulator